METETSFLTQFFGEGNEISRIPDPNEAGKDQERVRPWVESYLSGVRPAPLPRVRKIEGGFQTTWYIIVDDRDAAALARAEIQGFLGPSYTDWDLLTDRFDPHDAIDALVREQHPHSLKVTITGSLTGVSYHDRALKVRTRLELWGEVRGRQPSTERDEKEFLADLIYRFEDALRLGRWDLARDNLRKMGGIGGLSPENLAGLEFLYLEALGSWRDIWMGPSYDRLVEAGPPRRVAQAMLLAAYRCELQPLEESGDPTSALSVYTDRLAVRCGPLLGSAHGSPAREAHVLRLIREVTARDPTWGRIEAARARASRAGASETWLDALVDAAGVSPEAGPSDLDVYSRVGREFGLSNLDIAWDLAVNAPASAERSIWLVRLALEADSVKWAHDALQEMDQPASKESTSLVLAKLRDRLRNRFQVDPQVLADVPGGWLEWAIRLGEREQLTSGVRFAEQGRTDWRVEDAADPDWRAFADAIHGVAEANELILRRSVPHLLTAIGEDPPRRGGLASLYERLLNVVLLDPAPGDMYFVSVEDLVARRLALGVTAATYAALLADLAEQVEAVAAPANLTDVLALVDLLFFQTCPDPEARLRFVTGILTTSLGHLAHLSAPVLAVLSELAKEATWSTDPFGGRLEEIRERALTGDAPDLAGALDGLSVALYSLDEPALGRAKTAIRSLNPKVEVQTFSDKVASVPLMAAAKNAGLFVVAYRAAKHAATDAIQAARVGPIEFAQGKGSTSLVRAVWEWAEETTVRA